MKNKRTRAIQSRIAKQKQAVLETLIKVPIVEQACQQSDISRSTYYRWREQDIEFALAADKAVAEGVDLTNDHAEGKLLLGVREGQFANIAFWLKHRHPAYSPKLEIKGTINQRIETLSSEQEALVRKALELALNMTKGEQKDA